MSQSMLIPLVVDSCQIPRVHGRAEYTAHFDAFVFKTLWQVVNRPGGGDNAGGPGGGFFAGVDLEAVGFCDAVSDGY